MNILFVHQNCPGQFKHLAPRLAADPANRVVFISKPRRAALPGVERVEYEPKRSPSRTTHQYTRSLEDGVLHGQEVARKAIELRNSGFRPDVIIAHTGWGEALFLKDVWPRAALLGYFEFYYHAFGSDADFARQDPITLDDVCRIRTRNALHLLSLEAADWGIAPTHWQWQQQPAEFRHKGSIIHDGIDTATVRPIPDAALKLPNGRSFRHGEEVVTYIARNLEPYRGFPTFMRAAERILKRRPQCHILVVGGDGVSYGNAPKGGRKWREVLLEEVDLDLSRIHFLGNVPYAVFLRILQISAAHIYLTVPFVLSWSMLEAMAAECLVIGSRTPPVEEVIEDRRNGLLVDFFSPDEVADRVDEVLDAPDRMSRIRQAARQTVVERYELQLCLRRQKELIDTLAAGRRPQRLTALRPVMAAPAGRSMPFPSRRPERSRKRR